MFPLDLSYLRPNLGDDQRLYFRHFEYESKVKALETANQILYHPMHEASGLVADDHSQQGNDGAYTGVTLGETGIGDGRTCPLFDGANDYNDIHSAGFASDFDGGELTFAIWMKVVSGYWTSGDQGQLVDIRATAANIFFIRKKNTNNTMTFYHKGTNQVVQEDVGSLGGNTDWTHIAITASETNNEFIKYLNGSPIGTTQAGITDFSAAPDAGDTCIGAQNTTPNNPFSGHLAHAVIYKTILTPTQIGILATV